MFFIDMNHDRTAGLMWRCHAKSDLAYVIKCVTEAGKPLIPNICYYVRTCDFNMYIYIYNMIDIATCSRLDAFPMAFDNVYYKPKSYKFPFEM